MNRREFLSLIGVGSVGMLASPGVLAAMTTGIQNGVAPKLMFDGRYSDTLDYARQLQEKGIPAIDTQGDLVGLWYQDLNAFHLEPGQLMLGYTTWSDYQFLRGLIADARLGRESLFDRQGKSALSVHLQRQSGQDWPDALAINLPLPPNPDNPVHLVTWLAFNSKKL